MTTAARTLLIRKYVGGHQAQRQDDPARQRWFGVERRDAGGTEEDKSRRQHTERQVAEVEDRLRQRMAAPPRQQQHVDGDRRHGHLRAVEQEAREGEDLRHRERHLGRRDLERQEPGRKRQEGERHPLERRLILREYQQAIEDD